MPNWQPNWSNVRWDWGVADEAVRALRRTADHLDQVTQQRIQVAADIQREWRGRYRIEFDQQLSELVRRADQLASECRDAANRIVYASQRAYDEQRHREAERRRWQREKEEEERERRRRG